MRQMKQKVPVTADKKVLRKVALNTKISGTGNSLKLKDLSLLLDDSTLKEQFTWFSDTLNAYVNVLRPLVRNYNE